MLVQNHSPTMFLLKVIKNWISYIVWPRQVIMIDFWANYFSLQES